MTTVFWTLYVSVLWLLVAAFIGLGILGIVKPETLRALFGYFTRRKPVRVAGVLSLVLGALLLVAAARPEIPATSTTALGIWAALCFIGGLARLFDPTMPIVFMRWFLEFGNGAYRFMALLYFLVAGFVYWVLKVVGGVA